MHVRSWDSLGETSKWRVTGAVPLYFCKAGSMRKAVVSQCRLALCLFFRGKTRYIRVGPAMVANRDGLLFEGELVYALGKLLRSENEQ